MLPDGTVGAAVTAAKVGLAVVATSWSRVMSASPMVSLRAAVQVPAEMVRS